VKIEKSYVFEGPDGKCTLADLFQGRSQLAVYHFMLTPGSDHVCKGCSFVADHFDAARKHFDDADLAFAVISRAPIERIEQVKRALGWAFPWVSSYDSDFNFDFRSVIQKQRPSRWYSQVQLRHDPAQEQRRYDGRQHIRQKRDRRNLSHLLDLFPRH
jgi:predicted dithiol-disulfide oxidoreductase (DUF899 family)